MRTLFVLALGATLPTLSSAFTFDDIRFWVGTGSNRAAFVVDFRDGKHPESFAWGFRWDGAATGKTMMDAIDSADALYEADVVFSSFGYYVDAMRYLPTDSGWVHSGGSWPAGYFSYWLRSSDAEPWQYATTGLADRALSDGSWDGWAWVPNVPGTDALPPSTPVAAVPEPSMIAALTIGLGAFWRRRRAR